MLLKLDLLKRKRFGDVLLHQFDELGLAILDYAHVGRMELSLDEFLHQDMRQRTIPHQCEKREETTDFEREIVVWKDAREMAEEFVVVFVEEIRLCSGFDEELLQSLREFVPRFE